MAAIPGSVRVAGFIAPTDSTDAYAVTDETYNRGGYRSVSTLADRDAITADRRKIGMLVYVIGEDKYYTIKAGVTNADWVEWAPSGGSTGEPTGSFAKLNGDTVVVVKGMAVYIDTTTPVNCLRARADSGAAANVAGLALNDSVPTGGSVQIASSGLVEKTTLMWDFLTGGTGGLQAGRDYFLRADLAGGLTHIPPTAEGTYVVKLGRALTDTVFDINLEPPILL